MSTAVRFDASGDYLRKTTSLLDYNAAYTFCFWVYLASNTSAGYQAILTLSGGGSAYDELFIDGSRVLSLEVGNGSSTKVTGATLALSTWYHITVVRESTTSIKVYLDGSSTPTITNTQSVSGRIAIGNLSFSTNAFSEWADCRAAYARAWTAALSTAELAAEKNSATAVKASPWAVWSLQTNGTDSSGNSRDLTAGGTLTYSEAGPNLPLVITPAAASVAATAVAPTVTTGSGAVTVTPAAGSVAATAVAPTTVLGAISIAPTKATVAATAVAPTTVLGAITLTPTKGTAAATAIAPTVVYGALTITPTAATVASTAIAPTVIAGAAIVPAAASAIATAVAPTTILGASTTTPTPATAAATAVAPTTILGAITITPTAASATASAVAPTVSAGAAITPAAASVASSAVAPTVVLGASTTTPAPASVVASAIAPSVMITVIISAILLTARTRIPNVTARRVLGLSVDRDFDVRFRGG
jgi:hypothetical protein